MNSNELISTFPKIIRKWLTRLDTPRVCDKIWRQSQSIIFQKQPTLVPQSHSLKL